MRGERPRMQQEHAMAYIYHYYAEIEGWGEEDGILRLDTPIRHDGDYLQIKQWIGEDAGADIADITLTSLSFLHEEEGPA